MSNKAVSRWENGDSFPDVGILESLAAVLDVHIQDIITGDPGIHDESVVTEVVRVAKLQHKEKKRKVIRNSGFIVAMLGCIISGYSALGNSILFANDSILVYEDCFIVFASMEHTNDLVCLPYGHKWTHSFWNRIIMGRTFYKRAIATMYMTVLYGDMLHRMNSTQGVAESLAIRTLAVLVAVGISLGVAKIIKVKATEDLNFWGHH